MQDNRSNGIFEACELYDCHLCQYARLAELLSIPLLHSRAAHWPLIPRGGLCMDYRRWTVAVTVLLGWLTLATLHGLDNSEKVKIHGLITGGLARPLK